MFIDIGQFDGDGLTIATAQQWDAAEALLAHHGINQTLHRTNPALTSPAGITAAGNLAYLRAQLRRRIVTAGHITTSSEGRLISLG